jgi:hypothetical protein
MFTLIFHSRGNELLDNSDMNTIQEILGYSQLHQENQTNENFPHLQREMYVGDTRRNTQHGLREEGEGEGGDDDNENKEFFNKKGI